MKAISRKILFVFILISFSLFLSGCTAKTFTFAVTCDSRGNDNGINSIVLKHLLKDIQQSKAEFLVFPGDLVTGSPDPNINKTQLIYWKNIAHSLYDHKVYPVIGSHEAQSKAAQTAYTQLFSDMPQNGPEDEKLLTYYFDYENTRFVALDTDYAGDNCRVRHLDWLEETLKEARKRKIEHIFVFGHQPAFPVGRHIWDSLPCLDYAPEGVENYIPLRDAFWNLLKKYNVDAYICGHEHVYARQKVDGIWQILAGGAGATLYPLNAAYPKADASEEQKLMYEKFKPYYEKLGYPHGPNDIPQAGVEFFGKEFYHYVLIKIEGKNVQVQAYGFSGKFDSTKSLPKPVLFDNFEINSSSK